jgi:hypothetical protein
MTACHSNRQETAMSITTSVSKIELDKAGAELRLSCDEKAFNEIREVLDRARLPIGEGLE